MSKERKAKWQRWREGERMKKKSEEKSREGKEWSEDKAGIREGDEGWRRRQEERRSRFMVEGEVEETTDRKAVSFSSSLLLYTSTYHTFISLMDSFK